MNPTGEACSKVSEVLAFSPRQGFGVMHFGLNAEMNVILSDSLCRLNGLNMCLRETLEETARLLAEGKLLGISFRCYFAFLNECARI